MTVWTPDRDLASVEGLNAAFFALMLASTVVDQVAMAAVGTTYNPPFSVKTSLRLSGTANDNSSYSGEIGCLCNEMPSRTTHVLLLLDAL